MKLLSPFKTPAWEHRDAERRARAVREETAPELLARLAEIAAQDAEPAVRRAALARLSVPAQLLERGRADTDAGTREVALQRLAKLLLDPAAGLAPGARLSALSLDLPAELVERVAEQGADPEARRAALARVSRPAFLARRCADETDPALRAELLERIEGEDALDRLAEALRKRDKTLARRARERAEALRLGRADAGALARWADGACAALTDWARELPEDLEARLADMRATFEARRGVLLEAQSARIEAYFARVQDARDRQQARAQAASAPPPDAGPEASAPGLLQGEAGYAEAVEPPLPARPATDWSALDRALADANRAAAAKHVGEARPALEQVHALLGALPKLDRARRERLAEIEARVGELEQWQRWGGNRVRARLCEELEALIAAAPHPDAVANKVRELQQEWARVEAAEPGEAARDSGLARRFRALCGRAMAPTRPYFEQRHALREQRREALEAQLLEATPEALAALAPPAAIGLRRRLVEALRGLDELEPRARTALARRLREALTRLDAHLDAQREDAALARRKLIAQLRRELTHAAPADALALARDAQQQWKTLPRVAREQEGALDAELRSLIDPLFAREREQRQQAEQQTRQQAGEARRVLEELDALARADAATLTHAEGRLAALQANWRELQAQESAAERGAAAPPRDARGDANRRNHRDGGGRREDRAPGAERRRQRGDAPDPARRERERAFDQAVARVRQAQATLAQAQRGARLDALGAADALFARRAAGEPVDALQAVWDALALDPADRARLLPRWGVPAPFDAAREAQAERWLVEAELDLALDSPPDAAALRREVQMQRLAQRLQGGGTSAPAPLDRMHAWLALAPLDPGRHAARRTRLARVLAAWSAGDGAR